MLALAWRRTDTPTILELMPPQYRPTLRQGVIGIGDRAVLASFRGEFFEQPRPDLTDPAISEALGHLARQTGTPINPPRYNIHDAAANVASAFLEAIRIVRPRTVAAPIQLSTIALGTVRFGRIASSADGNAWEIVSAGPAEAKVLRPPLVRIPHDASRRRAVQLFD